MDLNTLEVHHTELGTTFCIARPAFTLEINGELGLRAGALAVFELWLSLLPDESVQTLHCYDGGHSFKPVDSRRLRRIRKALTEEHIDAKGCSYTLKDCAEFGLGGFVAEFQLIPGERHPDLNDRIILTLPWETASDPGRALTLFQSVLGLVDSTHAVAGYGWALTEGREFEQTGMPQTLQLSRRYHGLLLRQRMQESWAVRTFKSVNWLTFVGASMLEELGGEEAVQSQLSEEVEAQAQGGGLLLRAGEAPPLGDVNRGAPDLGPLKEVDRVLKQFRPKKWAMNGAFFCDNDMANEWLARLEAP